MKKLIATAAAAIVLCASPALAEPLDTVLYRSNCQFGPPIPAGNHGVVQYSAPAVQSGQTGADGQPCRITSTVVIPTTSYPQCDIKGAADAIMLQRAQVSQQFATYQCMAR